MNQTPPHNLLPPNPIQAKFKQNPRKGKQQILQQILQRIQENNQTQITNNTTKEH